MLHYYIMEANLINPLLIYIFSFYYFCCSREPLLIDRTDLDIRSSEQEAPSGHLLQEAWEREGRNRTSNEEIQKYMCCGLGTQPESCWAL